ncbi:MAG: hypothetical protein LBS45_09940 [Synergistaceae bacterium]|jgi:tRNA nucleotidyltransferase (CCA-adding enzyme)|nr:hypothetical protein [Synergistaceae bacterium]
MEEADFVRKINDTGGRAYVAGGWVRDHKMGVPGRDKDYVVTGVAESAFKEVFPCAIKAGGRFPVYRLEITAKTSKMCDVSLARRETKSGRGYRGFEPVSSPLVTIEEDMARRDTTVNAMAVDLETGELIDPYGGMRDLQNGVIRAVSERFADDPVRALRAARQAAQFGFRIEPDTVRLMARCRDELAGEPAERLVNELKLAMFCRAPSIFFVSLDAAEILDVTYPAVQAPANTGPSAFSGRMRTLDRAAALTRRAEIRFAALAADAAPEWKRMARKLPRLWVKCALFASSWCKSAFETREPDAVRNLLEQLSSHPIGSDGFKSVILAIYGHIPPILERVSELERAMRNVKVTDAPDGLSGERLGAWLKDRRNAAIAKFVSNRTD